MTFSSLEQSILLPFLPLLSHFSQLQNARSRQFSAASHTDQRHISAFARPCLQRPVWLILSVTLLQILSCQVASCSGVLKIELKQYQNPTNQVANGDCCDNYYTCNDDCDPYFTFTFNATEKSCNPEKEGEDIHYTQQSLLISFPKLQVCFLNHLYWRYDIIWRSMTRTSSPVLDEFSFSVALLGEVLTGAKHVYYTFILHNFSWLFPAIYDSRGSNRW